MNQLSTILFVLLCALTIFTGCGGSSYGVKETTQADSLIISSPATTGIERSDTLNSADFKRMFTAGALRAMHGDYAGAIRYYQATLRANPNHSPSFEGIARSFAGQEQFDSALLYARKAAAINSADLEVHRLLAELWVQNGEFDSGSAEYEHILVEQPNDLQARFMVARTWERRDPAKAILNYKYIRNNITEDFNTLVGLYQVYSEKGSYDQAASALQALIAQNPNDPNLHDLHCGVWIDAEEYDSANAALQLAAIYLYTPELLAAFIEPELTMTELRLRTSYTVEDGLKRFARSLVQLAVHQMEDYARPTYQAGMVALRLGADSNADILLDRAFQSDELSAIAWTEAARTYLEQGLAKRMLQTLAASADRYTKRAEVSLRMAQAFKVLGMLDSTRTYLEQAVHVDPEYGEAWLHLAEFQAQEEGFGPSIASYEQALSADPYNPELLNEYARTLAGAETFLEKSLGLIERALRIEPENERYLATRGWIAYLQNDYDTAVRYLQQAVGAGGATAELLELLGDAHHATTDNQNAVTAYNQALSIVGVDTERKLRLQKKIHDIEL